MTNQMHASRTDVTDPTSRRSILAQIHEGMAVYDFDNHHIGSVDFVHFGAASELQQELGAGAASPGPADSPQMREDSFIDNIAEAFSPNEVPQELQERLLQNGYIRLNSDGLFAADRFITPDQITGVTSDGVQLAVTHDQLIKRR
jgi:hypothetical protein